MLVSLKYELILNSSIIFIKLTCKGSTPSLTSGCGFTGSDAKNLFSKRVDLQRFHVRFRASIFRGIWNKMKTKIVKIWIGNESLVETL